MPEMAERSDFPGWLLPLVAIVIFGLSSEILFMTVYQDKTREMSSLAQHVADLQTKAQEGKVAKEHLDQFHNQVRELDGELAKLDHITPQTADLAADAEERWLRETFAAAGFKLRKIVVGRLEDHEFVTSRRTPFEISTPYPRIDELLRALARRLPAHGLTALTETRHAVGESTYRIDLEVSAVRQAPRGGR